jgi:hypothetical protein
MNLHTVNETTESTEALNHKILCAFTSQEEK